MNTAKKIVRARSLKEKTRSVIPEEGILAEDILDFATLAKDLTWPERMSDEQVQAILEGAEEKRNEVFFQQNQNTASVKSAPIKSNHLLSRIALLLSVITIVLLLVTYAQLNKRVVSMTAEVQELTRIKNSVTDLGDKVEDMEVRIAALDSLPQKTRAALLTSFLQELSQKTAYMAEQVQTAEQKRKLGDAQKLILQVQEELNTFQ